jgi:hypothetical protein
MKTHPANYFALTLAALALNLSAIQPANAAGAIRYVNVSNTAPAAPYTSWGAAATNIQNAIDTAVAGDQILVTNGVYRTGGRVVYGAMTNRVAVTKPVTVQSINGPAATMIQGYQVPGITNGDGAIRCVYLTNGACLSGFTLTNGATRYLGDFVREMSGGGIYCESTNAWVTNCVVVCNSADYYGGGSYSGTLSNCTLAGNSAENGGGASHGTLNYCALTANSALYGGGASYGTLNNCTLMSNTATQYFGGGAFFATLNNCLLTSNSASGGGGADGGTLNYCTLTGNSATFTGGGADDGCTLNNCTLTGNSAYDGGGAYECGLYNCTLTGNSATSGGGVYYGTLKNCILYFNTAPDSANHYQGEYGGALNYCCTTPMPARGVGDITNAPLFVDQAGGNLRLQSNSPCINAGINEYLGAVDLDGNPRIQGGTVDIGAYELQSPASVLSYVWAQQYGLPTDGSADYSDFDFDGLNNWQEWQAGTIPTNALSVLRLSSPARNGSSLVVTWQSVTNRTYFIERSTNLDAQPAFLTRKSNIAGQSGTTSYTDTNAIGSGPFFYRVRVQ